MNIFEYHNYDYDYDYQQYLDWKIDQEDQERELEGYERDLEMERQMDDWRVSQYEAEKEETTGERCVREAQEEEEHVRQLAQFSVDGTVQYELEWLPETREVRVEMGCFHDGSPMYLWYRDTMGTTEVLAKIMGIREEKIRITGLTFFTDDDMFVALDYEQRQFMKNTWRDYTDYNMVMQFNMEIIKDTCPNKCYDAACNGTNCEFNTPRPNKEPRPHGIDGTQCDCSDCTLDYGLCSCGCAGDSKKHAEWLEEREAERQAFVHETAEPLGGTLAEYMKDYMDEPEPDSPKPTLEIEDDGESTSSVESAEEKESRLWSDFKLAMMSALMALILGAYICRSLIC